LGWGHEFGSIDIEVSGQSGASVINEIAKNADTALDSKNIQFAGASAQEVTYGDAMGANYKNIIVAHGSLTFDIQVGGDEENFDTILSTFKFTK
jgi:hypothetical protein